METKLNKIEAREIMPGCHGKVVHGEKMTLVFWDIDQNAIIPSGYDTRNVLKRGSVKP